MITEGERQTVGLLILGGWAMRHRALLDGRRQIIRFLLPGDLCDSSFFVFRDAPYSIEAVTRVQVAKLTSEKLLSVFADRRRIAGLFWWLAGREHTCLQERVVTLGAFNAYERTAELLLDLCRRASEAGLMVDRQMHLPLTQAHLGQALGLTATHVHRVLRRLQDEQVVRFRKPIFELADPERLQQIVETAERRHFDVKEPSSSLRRSFALGT